MALLGVVAGCGGGGHGSTTESEKAADAEVLDSVLSQELTAIAALERGSPHLRGSTLALARQLRGQDQGHVDALTKAFRGLGEEVEAEAGELEETLRDRKDALRLAYEAESDALAYDIDAERRLQTTAPRALAASIAASHAQHLVVLRQALGASVAASIPEAFESGDLPPPGQPTEAG